jgi:hypothetical protein
MIRRILAIALTLSAAAQETTFLPQRTIATPFYGPVVELSPDSTLLAVHENYVLRDMEVLVPVDLPILLIDLETGSEVGRLEGAQVDVARSVAFSPDGSQLASYHVNGDLIIWDIATQEAIQVYDWLPMGGSLMDYMPDGQTLVLAHYNGMLGQHILFDLTSGSIVDMLGLRPDTFAEYSDIAGVPLEMGIYSIAAQTVGPNGELYGATGNGDVYRWDTETRLRELIYPASDERPMRYTVRNLVVLDDGTLAFQDTNTDSLVVFGTDRMRTEYPLDGQRFGLSDDGIAVTAQSPEDGLMMLDLNAEPLEAQPLLIDLGTDADGDPIEMRGDLVFNFTANGDLIVGGVYNQGGDGAIYIVDLP